MRFKYIFIGVLIFLLLQGNAYAQTLEQDSLALVALYQSTGGDNWTNTIANNKKWLVGPVATWLGVTVSGERVITLDLNNNNLVGSVNASFNLSQLTTLNLSNSKLSSLNIFYLGNLRNLYANTAEISEVVTNPLDNYYMALNRLQLEYNKLTAVDIKGMPKLTYFYAFNNPLINLTTNQTPGYYNEMYDLRVHQTSLTLMDISNMPKLGVVYANNCQLETFITNSQDNYYTTLSRLQLEYNKLTDVDIKGMSKLTYFYGFNNPLTSLITNHTIDYYSEMYDFRVSLTLLTSLDISNMPKLGVVYANNCQLETFITNSHDNYYNALSRLQIEYNKITSANIKGMPKLVYCYVHNNFLTSFLTNETANYYSQLYDLRVNYNKLEAINLSGTTTTSKTVSLHSNNFTFEDIELLIPKAFTLFLYYPQDSIETTYNSSTRTFSVTTGGSANQYQWRRNGESITGATGSSYTLSQAEPGGAKYQCLITNTIVPNLTLYTKVKVSTAYINPLQSDSLALVALYQSTGGDNWTNTLANNKKWLVGPVSTWHGVTMANGRVTALNLGSNNLIGSVNSSFNPSELKTLYLNNNQLTSLDISGLPNVELLYAYQNKLTQVITSSEASYYSKLSDFRIQGNDFSRIDISNMPALRLCYLYASSAGNVVSGIYYPNENFTEVVTNPTANYYYQIETFHVAYSALSSVNLSGMQNLKQLAINNSKLISLDISKLPNLEMVGAYQNKISELVTNTQASYYSKLTDFRIQGNDFSRIDISNMPALKICYLYASSAGNVVSGIYYPNENFTEVVTNSTANYYYQIETFHVAYSALSSVDLSGMQNLKQLAVNNSKLTSLDISKLPNLELIAAYQSKISQIVTSNQANFYGKLTDFRIHGNDFSRIDISNMPALKTCHLYASSAGNVVSGIFYANENLIEVITNPTANYYYQIEIFHAAYSALSSVDLSGMQGLKQLAINNSKLTSLNIAGLNSLTALYVYKAKLTFEDLEPLASRTFTTYQYAPQDSVETIYNFSTRTFSVTTGGSANQYQWRKNGTSITGATSSSYTLSQAEPAGGKYQCLITNTIVPNLTLYSKVKVSTTYVNLLQQDSLALVDFYNSTAGTSWVTKTNWLTGRLNTWYGVTVTNGRVTGLNLNSNNITGSAPASFTNLTALTTISFHNNKISSIDISTMPKLTYVAVSWNQTLTSFTANSSENYYPDLITLNLQYNNITTADIRGMPALKTCNFNGTDNATITNFYSSNSANYYYQLTDLILVSNKIVNLDISGMPALITLHAHYNKITEIITSNSPGYYSKLANLYLYGNSLNSLDVSNMPALTLLYAYNNQITQLITNVSDNYYSALIGFQAYSNKIASLNINGMPALQSCMVYSNQLTEIITNTTINYYSKLTDFRVNENKIISLNIFGMPALTLFYAYNNQLTQLTANPADNYYSALGNFHECLRVSFMVT